MAGVIEKRKQLHDEMSRFEAEISGPSNSDESNLDGMSKIDRPIIGSNTFDKVQQQIQDLEEDMPPLPTEAPIGNILQKISNNHDRFPGPIENSGTFQQSPRSGPQRQLYLGPQGHRGFGPPLPNSQQSCGPQRSPGPTRNDYPDPSGQYAFNGPMRPGPPNNPDSPNQFGSNFYGGPRPFGPRPGFGPGPGPGLGPRHNLHPNNRDAFPPGGGQPDRLPPPPPPPPGFMDGPPQGKSIVPFGPMRDLHPPPPPPGFVPQGMNPGGNMNCGPPNRPSMGGNSCNPRMGIQPPAFLRPPPPPPGLIPPRVAAMNRPIGPTIISRPRGPNLFTQNNTVVSSGPIISKPAQIISSEPKLYVNSSNVNDDATSKTIASSDPPPPLPIATETITFPSESKRKKPKVENKSKIERKQGKGDKQQQQQNNQNQSAALAMAEKVKASTTTMTKHSNNPNAKNPHEERKGRKPKKNLRYAGGQIWEDTNLLEWDPDDFRLFAGDLGNDVTDELLNRIFSQYQHFVKAKVVRDKRTNKSKGYGFVSFNDPGDYIRAMKEIDGKYVGSRPIKLRKSCWKDRNLDVVSKKQKEKQLQGLK